MPHVKFTTKIGNYCCVSIGDNISSVWVEIFVIIVFSVFYLAVTLSHFDHNDFMYATSAHMTGTLYKDIHYVQAPFGYYFWHSVFEISPSGLSYPVFRVVSALLGLGGIFLAAYGLIPKRNIRLIFIALAASSFCLLDLGGEIGTYTLALFLCVLGYVVLFNGGSPWLRYGVAAAAIGLAASSKLNHIALGLPMLALLYLERKEIKFLHGLIAISVGGLLGLLPCIVSFAQRPEAFLLHNVLFHRDFMINAGKGEIWGAFRTIPKTVAPFLHKFAGAFVLGLCAFGTRSASRRQSTILLLAAICAFSMAFLPVRIFPQYLGPAALFISLFYCATIAQISAKDIKLYVAPILAIALVGVGENTYFLMHDVRNFYNPILEITSINNRLRSFRESHSLCDNRIFSLSGALVNDSGFQISRNMEGGAFWQHLAGHIPERYFDDQRYQINRDLIDPADWVTSAGIRFWVLGYYPDSMTEKRLEQIAEQKGYRQLNLPDFMQHSVTLYYDPSCLRPASDSKRSS